MTCLWTFSSTKTSPKTSFISRSTHLAPGLKFPGVIWISVCTRRKSCAHVVEDTRLLVTHPVSDSFLLFESLCGFSLQELKIPDNGPKTVSSATFIRCTHGNLRIRRWGGGECSQGTAVCWGVMGEAQGLVEGSCKFRGVYCQAVESYQPRWANQFCSRLCSQPGSPALLAVLKLHSVLYVKLFVEKKHAYITPHRS